MKETSSLNNISHIVGNEIWHANIRLPFRSFQLDAYAGFVDIILTKGPVKQITFHVSGYIVIRRQKFFEKGA